MRRVTRLLAAVIALGLALASYTSSPARPQSPVKAGFCYRMGASCHHDVVLVEPSGDKDLDEAGLEVYGEGRFPERCEGYDHHWLGKFIYRGDVAVPADVKAPSCDALPKWPSRKLKTPMQAHWNVPAVM
ncbi:MAG TPA: hypothetical protein VFE18_07255 [Phenylobacterium sp.]|jgi:hypothetical protein|uniref:hypothetical protein n=1 Tax=Phenylobacterium sp. TaxID=1871053 RepID=UPI002D23331A|nr:hypothetical protein [Phenylobacterium sp.]HZZ67954.1 hypothetical protein [Phenylobacterium sp.]